MLTCTHKNVNINLLIKNSFCTPKKKPKGYWNNVENVNKLTNDLKFKLKLNSIDDWNKLTKDQISKLGGSGLFKYYSLYKVKCLGCPELPSKRFGSSEIPFSKENLNINRKPKGYWDDTNNVLKFIEQLKEEYNLTTLSDWKKLTNEQIQNIGGRTLLNKLSKSKIQKMGCIEFNEKYNAKKPFGFWDDMNNIREFLDIVTKEYKITKVEDWNNITIKDIKKLGGNGLIEKKSLIDIKMIACEGKCTDKLIIPPKISKGHWNKVENIQKFCDLLKEKYSINSASDWENITWKQVYEAGGSYLLKKFSLLQLKAIACPDLLLHNNKPRKANIPQGYWENSDNIRNFLLSIQKEYNLETENDWNRISRDQIRFLGGGRIFSKFSLYDLLCIGFPEKKWNKQELLKRDKRATQRWLFLQIKKLYPTDEIIEDYIHEELTRISGRCIQFDIYNLNKHIAFEYHGKQHYEDIPSGFNSLEVYKQNDNEKKLICYHNNIPLIVIPYWWDNSLNQLQQFLEK